MLTTGANAPVESRNAPVVVRLCPTSTKWEYININVHSFIRERLKTFVARNQGRRKRELRCAAAPSISIKNIGCIGKHIFLHPIIHLRSKERQNNDEITSATSANYLVRSKVRSWWRPNFADFQVEYRQFTRCRRITREPIRATAPRKSAFDSHISMLSGYFS